MNGQATITVNKSYTDCIARGAIRKIKAASGKTMQMMRK
jgi:hypothetical protein